MQRRRPPLRTLAILLPALAALALPACAKNNEQYRKEGLRAYRAGNYPLAQERFGRAVNQNATDWNAHYYLGRSYMEQGRPLDAQLHFEKALTLRDTPPERDMILDALAESLLRQDQLENLALMLQKAADEYHTSRDFRRQARYLARIGDVDGAKLAYEKTLMLAPADDATPYIELADFLESVGDTQGAIRATRQAYYIAPQRADLADRLRRYGLVPGPTVALPPDAE